MNTDLLKADLTRDEGLRLKGYKDTVGKFTIGIGHNIEDAPISHRAAMLILEDDIVAVSVDLDRNAEWWKLLSEPRQRALANMLFNMGWARLSGFRKMLMALQAGDWQTAAHEALASKWAEQVGPRAQRIARMFLEG